MPELIPFVWVEIGQNRAMQTDFPAPNGDPEEEAPPPGTPIPDPDALKSAHGRTGEYLKKAGLPFEDDEFEEDPAVESPDSSPESEED
jgi:hypothetical protein